MSKVEIICSKIGDFAKDSKLNIDKVLSISGSPGLGHNQIYAIALASAYSTSCKKLAAAILDDGRGILSEEEIFAVKAATNIMAMNNVYYRFLHSVSDQEMFSMPANLRMQVIDKSGVNKIDFEMYSLAVSALNGCGLCMKSHKGLLEKSGVSKLAIQSVIRIASVINSVSNAFSVYEIDKSV